MEIAGCFAESEKKNPSETKWPWMALVCWTAAQQHVLFTVCTPHMHVYSIAFRVVIVSNTNRRENEKTKTTIIKALLLQLVVLSTSLIYSNSTKSHRNDYIVQSLFPFVHKTNKIPEKNVFSIVRIGHKVYWTQIHASSEWIVWLSMLIMYLCERKKNARRSEWNHFKQLRTLAYQPNSH